MDRLLVIVRYCTPSARWNGGIGTHKTDFGGIETECNGTGNHGEHGAEQLPICALYMHHPITNTPLVIYTPYTSKCLVYLVVLVPVYIVVVLGIDTSSRGICIFQKFDTPPYKYTLSEPTSK